MGKNDDYWGGRPLGSGQYGEPTKVIRVPVSLVGEVKAWLMERVKKGKGKNGKNS